MNQPILDNDALSAYYAWQLVKRHEGFRPKPYPDTGGTWAVGYGTNFFTRGISESEAGVLAQADIHKHQDELANLPWFEALNPPRKAALLDVSYATGVAGLLKFGAMIVAIQKGDFEAAAEALMASRFGIQSKHRAPLDAGLLRSGVWPKGAVE